MLRWATTWENWVKIFKHQFFRPKLPKTSLSVKITQNQFSRPKSTKTSFSVKTNQHPFFRSKTSFCSQNRPKPCFGPKSIMTSFSFRQKPVSPAKIDYNQFFWSKSTKTHLFGQKPVFFQPKSIQTTFFSPKLTKTSFSGQKPVFPAKIDQNKVQPIHTVIQNSPLLLGPNIQS